MTADQEARDMCTFTAAEYLFGVDVVKVHEVIRNLPMTPVPLAPPVIRGLINLRGQIVTALDLRRRMELGETGRPELPVNVVLRTADGPVSLLVDEIGEVLTVSEHDVDRSPNLVHGAARRFVTGVAQLTDRLLLILDVEKVVDVGGGEPEAALAGE